MKREIDVTRNGVYIVEDGQLTAIKPPESGYGEQIVIWVNGKVSHTHVTTTVKFK
ncbi:DUF3954 domain-containing protein [Bacillus cereus]|nr:DUF3954 domain-containing protein [Bacillus cereus]